MKVHALIIAALSVVAGCSMPIKPISKLHIKQIGVQRQASMGDSIYVRYLCPCFKLYEFRRSVKVEGIPILKAGSLWIARYENTRNGNYYLMDPMKSDETSLGDADFAIAIRTDGTINPTAAVVQFRGMKAGRSWPLENPEDADAIRYIGYWPSDRSWAIFYIGPDAVNPNTLRFSIADFQGVGSDSESKGQLLYVHNLALGNEFVIRGIRIKVINLSKDGVINYVILDESD